MTYDYRCKTCGERFEFTLPMDQRHNPPAVECEISDEVSECNLVLQIGSPSVVSGINPHSKTPDWFKDRVKEVKKAHPANTIDSKW